MKLLYLPCHCVLEYDELRLFHELGIEFFSLGDYSDPKRPTCPIRPIIDVEPDPKWLALSSPAENLSQELIDDFDAVMVMHMPQWIENNWEKLRKKTVIWRSIGQSTPRIERVIMKFKGRGLRIVRYSPRENMLRNFAGEDRMIRFYKDPGEFGGWTGGEAAVLSVYIFLKTRRCISDFLPYDRATRDFPRKLFGGGNEDLSYSLGEISYEGMKEEMRRCRLYFSIGSRPAPYTLNFMEAFMTGIPVVAVGKKLRKLPLFRNLCYMVSDDLYEVPDFLADGAGFCGDSINELKEYISELLENHAFAKTVGDRGRQRAVELFGKEKIKNQWKEFFGSVL